MKNLCVECQSAQKMKNKSHCESCFDKQMSKSIAKDAYLNIRVDVPESKYF